MSDFLDAPDERQEAFPFDPPGPYPDRDQEHLETRLRWRPRGLEEIRDQWGRL